MPLTYDQLIERGASALAIVIMHPGPQNEDHLNKISLEAAKLRSGRDIDDGMLHRASMIDVMVDIVQALRDTMKGRLLETLPAKLGVSRDEVERALAPALAMIATRQDIEQIFGL
jgi:hypothetical protein